jgi:hypothetical protein
MTFRDRADETAKAVADRLRVAPDDEQMKAVADLIEQAIINSYQDAADRCATVAMDCCSADQDMAHKVAAEIRRAKTALIATLSSLRWRHRAVAFPISAGTRLGHARRLKPPS